MKEDKTKEDITLKASENQSTSKVDVMGFLNEIQYKFPNAISLASGRPDDELFNVESSVASINYFVKLEAAQQNKSESEIYKWLGQYNSAKGVIATYLSKYYKTDYNWEVAEEDILVSVGAQEAMMLIVSALCDRENERILVESPTYVGCTEISKILGVEIGSVSSTSEDGIDLVALEQQLQNHKEKKVKLLYVIPDFQNPGGSYLSLNKRHELIDLANTYDFYILEDNPYGKFRFVKDRIPTLKELDKGRRVIYVESFAKTLFPSLRIAAVIADQRLANGEALIDKLSSVKGYVTVNTSLLNQAILAGILATNDFSLEQLVKPKVDVVKGRLGVMLEALATFSADLPVKVNWNKPSGGYFLTVSIPFSVSAQDVEEAARDYGVIFCPMSFFGNDEEQKNQIRLAFSGQTEENIKKGIKSLMRYLKFKCQQN